MSFRRSPQSRWNTPLRLEELESRVVPAAYLLNKYQVVWQDLANAGNTATFSVIATQPIFSDLATANSILKFNDGTTSSNNDSSADYADFVGSDNSAVFDGVGAFLRQIDLTGVAAPGLSLSIVSTTTASLQTTIGHINTNVDLNKVVVSGRLMGIHTTLPSNIAALTTHYLGTGDTQIASDLGTSVQPTTHSQIDGNLGLLKILTQIDNGWVDVQGTISQVVVLGNIGISDATAQPGYDVFSLDEDGNPAYTSSVSASAMGSVQIRGSIFGSEGELSGSVFTQPTSFGPGGNINSVLVSGSIRGGTGVASGQVSAFRNINSIQVIGSVIGSTQDPNEPGNSVNDFSGTIRSGWDATNQSPSTLSGDLPSVVIGGSLIGSSLGANYSGEVFAHGKIGQVQIKGSIVGGTGSASGRVHADLDFKSITVNGSVSGGPTADGADSSGEISSYVEDFGDATKLFSTGHNTLGTVRIGGTLSAGLGTTGGRIIVDGNLTSVTLAGNLQGGQIGASGNVGTVSVKGSVLGGSGDFNGAFFAGVTFSQLVSSATLPDGGSAISAGVGTITSVTVGGSVNGGAGTYSGSVIAGSTVKTVKIGKDFGGGTTQYAGYIHAETVTSVTVGGSIKGGSALNTAEVSAEISLGTIAVTGDVRGGSGDSSGRIAAYDPANSDSPVNITKVTVGGSVLGGDGSHSGEINATGNMGNVTIKKSVAGGRGEWSGSIRAGVANADTSTYQGTLANVSIGGDLKASEFTDSGSYNATVSSVLGTGLITIGGSIDGGTGSFSGGIFTGSEVNATTDETDTDGNIIQIKGVTVSKSIIAGINSAGTTDSGYIFSAGNLLNVTVGKDLDGSNNNSMDDFKQVSSNSARIAANGNIGTITTVGGKQTGGVSIGGFLRGGNNNDTGVILADANGDAAADGVGDLVTLKIAKGIIGGPAYSGQTVDRSAYVQAYNIGTKDANNDLTTDADTLTIGTSGIVSGINNGDSLTNSGAIRAANNVTNLIINGNVSGNITGTGSESRVVLTAGAIDNAVGSGFLMTGANVAISVKGSVSHTDIGAGYGTGSTGAYVDITQSQAGAGLTYDAASIGDITITGSLNSSNILAGVSVDTTIGGNDDEFVGGFDFYYDVSGASAIGDVTIGTATSGGVTGLDDRFYTISANAIGTFTVRGVAVTPGAITVTGTTGTAWDLLTPATNPANPYDQGTITDLTKGVLLYTTA